MCPQLGPDALFLPLPLSLASLFLAFIFLLPLPALDPPAEGPVNARGLRDSKGSQDQKCSWSRACWRRDTVARAILSIVKYVFGSKPTDPVITLSRYIDNAPTLFTSLHPPWTDSGTNSFFFQVTSQWPVDRIGTKKKKKSSCNGTGKYNKYQCKKITASIAHDRVLHMMQ